MTNRCAFLSMGDLGDFFVYDTLVEAPLATLGWSVDTISWRQEGVDWDKYDAVVVRSTWDYQDAPEAFLQRLEEIDRSAARLFNSLDIIRWNLSKTYLRDLQAKDIRIVNTRWHDALDAHVLSEAFNAFNTDKLIIKPVISANADHTFIIEKGQEAQKARELRECFSERPFMLQPFINEIQTTGEYSLFYFAGQFSHSILKIPERGDFRVQEEHGGTLHSVKPSSLLSEAGDRVIDALPEAVLYARVDFVVQDDTARLMEVELIEPSLYFNMDASSPRRFADALVRASHNSAR